MANKDWRMELKDWLAQGNPKTMPDDLRALREAFVARFPKERIADLTLEEYAAGRPGSFCYWIEFKTRRLGSISGGSAFKFGVWWSKERGDWRFNKVYSSADDALNKIKAGLTALVAAVDEGRFEALDRIGASHLGPNRFSLRGKPLSLYFPDQFLPIANPAHLAHFLRLFGEEVGGDLLERNRRLLGLLRGLPEFEGFDTRQMMDFLYDCLAPQSPEPAPIPDIKRMWKVAPGKGAYLWDMCREKACVVIGWLDNENYTRFTSKDELIQALSAADEGVGGASSIWPFVHEMQAGDLVVANKGLRSVVGIGIVRSGYMPPDQPDNPSTDAHHGHTRLVDWRITEPVTLDDSFTFAQQTLTPLSPEPWRRIKQAYLAQDPALAPLFLELDGEEIEEIIDPAVVPAQIARLLPLAGRSRNILLYGPPGTGKTWLVRRFAEHFLGPQLQAPTSRTIEDFCTFVTFHQSFAYEEFVEGLKPLPMEQDQTEVRYEVVPGVFRRICARAEAAWRERGEDAPKYLLIIDEINRANISKVFGELITLIEDDKRLGRANEITVTLPYSQHRFGVPPNLYLLGTMNTADRSIALLDLALRRRFTFVEMLPDAKVLAGSVIDGIALDRLLLRLNERVAALLDPDHQIGHSYLLNIEDKDDLRFAWQHRIVPLLQEYFYNDGARLRAVLGAAFVTERALDSATQKALGEAYDSDLKRYEIPDLEDDAFTAALRALAGQVPDPKPSAEATAPEEPPE